MPSSTKHTPGPWSVSIDAFGRVVLDTPDGSRTLHRGERAANARLIAAAPDLLAALRQIAKLYAPNEVAGEIACAAIAKAVQS